MITDYCNVGTVLGVALTAYGISKYAESEKKYQKASAVMVMSIGVAAIAFGYFQALDQVKLAAEIAHQDFLCPPKHLERANIFVDTIGARGINRIFSSLDLYRKLNYENYLKWQDPFYDSLEQRIVKIQPEDMKEAVMWGFTPENAAFIAFRGTCEDSKESAITVFQTTKNKVEELMISGVGSLSSDCKQEFNTMFDLSYQDSPSKELGIGKIFYFSRLIRQTFLELGWEESAKKFYLGHDYDFIS